MKMQALRRQHVQRALHRLDVDRRRYETWEVGYAEAMQQPGYWPYDDDDDYGRDDYACSHCGGEGWRAVDDIWWDECNEFGDGPCTSCRGTGQRKHQWVF